MKRLQFFAIAVFVAVFFAWPVQARDMNKVYDARDAAAAKGQVQKPSNFQMKNAGNEGKVVGKGGTSDIRQNRPDNAQSKPGSAPGKTDNVQAKPGNTPHQGSPASPANRGR